MVAQNQNPIHEYASLFARLTPDNLTELSGMVADNIVFSDPFNLTYGRDKFIYIFEHMFKVMDSPKFEILDTSISDRAGYIKWRLTGKVKKWHKISIDIIGMSEIINDETGVITAHYDHWDSASQLISLIPVFGLPTRWVLNLFKLK